MTAYYNEHDENAAAWLRELIKEGHIAPGDVDTRSIVDVRPGDLGGYEQCHFFAGIGGWSLALRYAGWPDDRPVWTGSCPCQPFSVAGRRKGFGDDRHLWPDFRRLVSERRPAKLYGEQVASAADWLRLVRGDLEALDYAVGAIPIEAASAGADHLRDRFWFVGDHPSERWGEGRAEHEVRSWGPAVASDGGMVNAARERGNGREGAAEPAGRRSAEDAGDVGNTEHGGCKGWHPERSWPSPTLPSGEAGLADADELERRIGDEQSARQQQEQQSDPSPRHSWVIGADGKARRVESGVRLLVDGFPFRVGLLRGFGNAIDPRPAAIFIQATS